MNLKQLSLYIHSPFCSHKCGYCDFNSWVSQNEEEQGTWLKALDAELSSWKEFWEEKTLTWKTVFLGGGTPSLLSLASLSSLSEILDRHEIQRTSLLEFSAECNPEDLSVAKLQALKELGVTRLSVGVQSFKKKYLNRLERQAEVQTNLKALDLVASTWQGPWSLDLMYGLPGQSLSEWEQDLEQAMVFEPPHISAYQLTLSTARSQNWKQESEDSLSRFFTLKKNFLAEHDYEHYETSNFAKNQAYSIHNKVYWELGEFLGVGPGAYGLLSSNFSKGLNRFGVHQKAPSSFEVWSKQALSGDGSVRQQFIEEREASTHLKELLLMGLRLKNGIDLERLGGEPFWQQIRALKSISTLLEKKSNRIVCTEKGSYLVDFINSELFAFIDQHKGSLDSEKIDPIFGR